MTELKQLRSEFRISMKKISRGTIAGPINVAIMCNSVLVGKMITADSAYEIMKQYRGTTAYWQQQLRETRAMLDKFGTLSVVCDCENCLKHKSITLFN